MVPDSIRLGSTSPGNMHVTGMSKDIRKLFFLVDIVNAQNPVDPREIGWIPIEKGNVEQIADLVRQFIGEDAAPGKPSIRPRGKKTTAPQLGPLDDFAGVDVLAVPAAKMLMVKAKRQKVEEARKFVRQIRRQLPSVLVLNREWTRAKALTKSWSCRSR